jgi:hypothetical protein
MWNPQGCRKVEIYVKFYPLHQLGVSLKNIKRYSNKMVEVGKMGDSILQLLLLLGYLSIGLIAITFAVYAISVNYLRQEKSESKKEQKKRLEELK